MPGRVEGHVMSRDSTTAWDNFDVAEGDLEALYHTWNNTREFVNYGRIIDRRLNSSHAIMSIPHGHPMARKRAHKTKN